MMTIGYDLRLLGQYNSGVGVYTINLLLALSQTAEDISFKLLYSRRNRIKGYMVSLDGQQVENHFVKLPSKMLNAMWAFLRWPPAEYFTGKVDIFHSTNYTLIPALAARRVITVHDLSFLIFPQFANKGARLHFARKIKDYCQQADQLWADSHHTRRDIIEMLGVEKEKIEVVNPIICDIYLQKKDPIALAQRRKRLGIDQPYVAYVGNLEPRKNLVRLIEAYERSGIADDFLLVIAGGPGWSNQAIYERMKISPLRKKIVQLGYLGEKQLVALYHGARFLVFPSLYEGFGMPLLESICCGTPVIAGNNSSQPEVVGQAGLLVDALDVEMIAAAMRSLAYDDSLRARLAAHCANQAARFAPDKIATYAIACYKKVA